MLFLAAESVDLLPVMACPGPNDPGDPFTPPKTPRMVLKDDARSEQLTPDTEDNVNEQTDGVFRNFVYHMTTMHSSRGAGDGDNGDMPELTAFADQPYS